MNTLTRIAALALTVCGHAASAADMSVFDLMLGQALRVPNCSEAVAGNADTCMIRKDSTEHLDRLELGYTVKAPRWVQGRTIWGYESGSRLIQVTIWTSGFTEQTEALASLTQKYGPPTSTASVTKKSGAGAEFESQEATWKLDGVVVAFRGMYDRVDRGSVTVGTADAEKIIAQEAEPERHL